MFDGSSETIMLGMHRHVESFQHLHSPRDTIAAHKLFVRDSGPTLGGSELGLKAKA